MVEVGITVTIAHTLPDVSTPGTAGLTVAARLSENPDVTVGVIEAGKYRIGDPFIDIPVCIS